MSGPEMVDNPGPSCPTFMRGDHYHCRSCGGSIQFLTRLHWESNPGVRAIGICKQCKLIMIESETALPKWIAIE